MPRVVHFEIPADNPERAVKFYSDVFGWQINKWEGPQDYWLVATGASDQPGIDGAITRRQSPVTVPDFTVDVESVDDAVGKVTASGGTVVAPRMPVPGVGYLAYCQDTEGNLFGVMQADETAR